MEFEEIDYWIAGANWVSWAADYDALNIDAMPVLSDDDRFRRFWKEYRLLQGEAGEVRPRIREWLSENLNFNTPVLEVAAALQEAKCLRGRQVSLITKILCFANPETYFPMDRYSRSGLRHQDNGPANPTYEDYNTRCHNLFDANKGAIDTFLDGRPIPTDNIDGFKRRVFDVALMRIGGR